MSNQLKSQQAIALGLTKTLIANVPTLLASGDGDYVTKAVRLYRDVLGKLGNAAQKPEAGASIPGVSDDDIAEASE